MEIAYFGLPLGALVLLAAGHRFSTVVLSPVRAVGARRLVRRVDPRRIVDCREGVEHERISRHLVERPPDVVFSWFWTRRLPREWLRAPLGAYGVHPSLLPRHRGPDPYFAAIDSGDHVTGVTLHVLDEQYDTGAIVWSETLAVGDRNAWQLARALDRPSLRLLRRAADELARGRRLPQYAQDESRATWAGEPEGERLRVRWSQSTVAILRRIRALAPVPGLALNVRGLKFFLVRASPYNGNSRALRPGEAMVVGGGVVIRTGDGAVLAEAALGDDGQTRIDKSALAELVAARFPRG